MTHDMENLQRAIRTARTARGMSLATLLANIGMKKAQIYQCCEKSRMYVIERVAKGLGMKTSELVKLAEDLPPLSD
jgi:ribosome-binding protein aMBF1 (putative translation factor)